MKNFTISEDQNTITLEDGAVLVATKKEGYSCKGLCSIYRMTSGRCNDIPCLSFERKDHMSVVFVKVSKVAEAPPPPSKNETDGGEDAAATIKDAQ